MIGWINLIMADVLSAFQPDLLDHLLAAFLRAMRVFAFVTGMLVIIDSCGLLLGVSEVPPHRPRANATAWLVAAGLACASSGWLLIRHVSWVTASAPVSDRVAGTMIWTGLGISFTVRAITRAKRPALTVWSAVLMCLLGTVLAFVSPVP